MQQGSTLTVVRLGITSLFYCRTTWTSAYGCPLVKLRKSTKWIILDRPFISDWVKWKLCSKSVNKFDLQCTHSCKFYLFQLCSKVNKEWLTRYTRPFHGWPVSHGQRQPGMCSPGWLRYHASTHKVVRGWLAAQKDALCGWCASGRW